MPIITPAGGPSATPIASSQPTQSQQSAKERAIAALLGNSNNDQPVPNANQVSPEEMSAVKTSEPKEEVGQPGISEEPKDAAAEETKPSEKLLSTQYAQLAKKERALRAEAQRLKAEREAFEQARKAPQQPQTPSFDESKYIARDRLKTDFLSVMAEEGVSYDEITNQVLNQSQVQSDPFIKAALERLEKQIKVQADAQERSAKAYEESQQQQYKQALNQIHGEAKALVMNDPEFETIKATNSIGDVVDLIEQTWKQDGVLITVEDAAREVENFLMEEALKITKLKKIQSRLAPSTPQAPKSEEPQAKQSQPQMKTLTNSVGSSKPLSAKDRAILAFQGKLNK